MFWIEMSRDSVHGGGDWGFTKCLWIPAYKKSKGNVGSKWAYWETVANVKEGDIVLHLLGKGQAARFVGFSVAESNGYETTERPLYAGQWDYASKFYKANLKDYTPLETPIMLNDKFKSKESELTSYYWINRERGKDKLRCFFVIQSNRLQCQNGAYLSEADEELARIIFDDWNNPELNHHKSKIPFETNTNTTTSIIKARMGHQAFSNNVKKNYNHECCFPSCKINSERYLRASHIARWADVPELRGQTSNGLCLCLMHDQDFEKGLFTITKDYRIAINIRFYKEIITDTWAVTNLLPFEDNTIKKGVLPPSLEALEHHWNRIKYVS